MCFGTLWGIAAKSGNLPFVASGTSSLIFAMNVPFSHFLAQNVLQKGWKVKKKCIDGFLPHDWQQQDQAQAQLGPQLGSARLMHGQPP